jgi:radical SAM superfamily enzyme YgiQ (UPF0313 family)
LVSPASLFDPKDPFTTGVVYMPIGLAYGASALLKERISVQVFDIFGEAPTRAERFGNYIRLGTPDSSLLQAIDLTGPNLIVFYANQVLNHAALLQSIIATRRQYPEVVIGVAENTQAVTSYFLLDVKEEFFNSGVDFLLTGELENTLCSVVQKLRCDIKINEIHLPGICTRNIQASNPNTISNLDALTFPAWEMFPIGNYWSLGYAHGPFESEAYLPILTSRGCPFPCQFCVIPSTNNRKWRPRSAKNVVDEMEYMFRKFGVQEFHLEDLNPTIQDVRMREISEEILRRHLILKWKIVAGTKVESIKSVDTLRLMKKSGLNYLSMSPESGSRKVQREIGKPFDTYHAIKILQACRSLDISTQACFVLGFPGEMFQDRIKSLLLAIRLTLHGLDEVVVFIMAPVPGSNFFFDYRGEYDSLSDLGFSPRWRKDFFRLLIWRLIIYFFFLILKSIRNPVKMIRQLFNVISGNYRTKMEMVPIRGIKYLWMTLRL